MITQARYTGQSRGYKMASDTIKSLMSKLLNMAQKGSEFEALIAKEKLDKLLKKHKLTILDIMDSERNFEPFKFGTKNDKIILFQIYVMVRQTTEVEIKTHKKKKKTVYLEVNKAEHAEIADLYDYYSKALKQDYIDMRFAFIQKHKLFAPSKLANKH
jgi:hypothetical protein